MRQVTKNQETKFFELSKSNIKVSKFNSLISPINNGDFLQWGLWINKNDFIWEKRLHKISLQVRKIVEEL